MNLFKNIAKDLLLEREGGFSKCSTQVNLREGKNAILKLANIVPDEHLHEYGRENEPHVTVLYGIKPSLTAQQEVEEAIRKSGLGEIRATLGNCSLFENAEFDVVKFEVISEGLHKLHETICQNVPFESDFPDYNPHCTVAYVKPGLGRQYVDRIGKKLAGTPLVFNAVQFSNVDGTKTPIELGYPDNETAQHPNTGEMNEDLGYGGGFQSGGNQGMGYMGGHQGVFNSPEVGANANKYKNYKKYTMMGNNTVVTSGYYDTVFSADVKKIMSILEELGIKTKGMPSNDDEEYNLKGIDTQHSNFRNPDASNVASSDDVMDDASGINITRATILKYLKNHFGDRFDILVKQSDGEIGFDEIMLGLKETMRDMKFPDKDYAVIEVLKQLIQDPNYYSALGKYDINEEQSYERSIYGTKFKPNEISNILKEFK